MVDKNLTPLELRKMCRTGEFAKPTSGYCPGHAQANLIILPKEDAYDFLLFAQRNPKACPVLEVTEVGSREIKYMASDCDVATDFPMYRIYKDGVMVEETTDVSKYWQDDFVAFIIGCSFSFESEMIDAGIEIRHNTEGRNVPMYMTNIECLPAGKFSGKMVVSMRPIPPKQVVKTVTVTATLPKVHGSPIHIGDPAAIGIKDINNPEFGDSVTINPGEVTVFWPCGVTPQSIVMNSKPKFAITHAPGYMLVLDVKNVDLKE
ncbi:MAG: putative hydro-lyase [Lachnospiraceae bacterium]|nr:putative hydro-lyase [Candidatus Equihabitans merdae]